MHTTYDGANTLGGIKPGTATQILKKSPKASLIYCFSHAFNLSVGNMIHLPFLDNIILYLLGLKFQT